MLAGFSRFSSTRRRTDGTQAPLRPCRPRAAWPRGATLARHRRGRAGGGLRRGRRAFLDDRQHLAAGHDRAALHPDLAHHAVGRRRDLQHHLVGLEVGEVLITARSASPGCLCQATRVASATDSGSCGTRISVLMSSFSTGSRDAGYGGPRGAACHARTPRSSWHGAQRPPAPAARARGSCRCRWRGPRPARARHRARRAGARQLLQAVADLVPGALILWLLLAPDDLARRSGSGRAPPVLLARERIQLLDAHQRHVARPSSRRALSRSKYTLPLQKTTRRTSCAAAAHPPRR